MAHRAPGVRAIGLGLITGAADDDPAAIGTYASAGAAFGPAFLWIAPAVFPMMFAVVYLSSKLGQVSGQGLFEVVRKKSPRWVLHAVLAGVLVGNTIEAAADLGGMAAGLQLLVPLPHALLVVLIAIAVVTLQIVGSYRLIRSVFRWLALSLLAYVAAALLAGPDWREVLLGTLVPRFRFDREFLLMIVAVIGTSLSAYLVTWQSNEEVEEKVERGLTTVEQRKGTTPADLRATRRDILLGMAFGNIVMYFIMLSTATTLHRAGQTDITSATQAASALAPVAGRAASVLFTIGIVAVGFLAVPVMTAGAAYDICQSCKWRHGLYAKFRDAKPFYITIIGFTAVAVILNFFGFNPMRALVWSGAVQGLTTPMLLLLVVVLTNKRSVMGIWRNSPALNALAYLTTAATGAAGLCFIISLFV